jgi:hypothetical protein
MNYNPGCPFNIETTCAECFYNPNSHSFHKLSENYDDVYFYTCHAKTNYSNDGEEFVKHMRLEIEKIKNKNWIWIVDGLYFMFKHLRTPKFGMKIINFLDGFCSINLQKIIIINENTPFKIMLSAIWRYIPEYIQKKFIFDKTKMFSELLNIDDKLYLLEKKLTF